MTRISRVERFERVGSTQDVVRAWLDDGVEAICVAVADEQTAGRGRLDRSWQAPPGAAILLSAGFRPRDLAPSHAWRLGAIVALAMLDAIGDVHPDLRGRLALKWPNDIVARRGEGVAKIGGVLGESVVDDGRVRAATVGIGLNADWPREAFPPELEGSMSSLREELSLPVDRAPILAAFLERLAEAAGRLDAGAFPADRWAASQVTTGARVELDLGGGERHEGTVVGVDPETGALLVRDAASVARAHLAGDVVRCRVGVVEGTL